MAAATASSLVRARRVCCRRLARFASLHVTKFLILHDTGVRRVRLSRKCSSFDRVASRRRTVLNSIAPDHVEDGSVFGGNGPMRQPGALNGNLKDTRPCGSPWFVTAKASEVVFLASRGPAPRRCSTRPDRPSRPHQPQAIAYARSVPIPKSALKNDIVKQASFTFIMLPTVGSRGSLTTAHVVVPSRFQKIVHVCACEAFPIWRLLCAISANKGLPR
jgi:hypothetical protein